MTRTVVAGALGDCTHVAGVQNFLRLAETAGWRTVFLGPAIAVPDFLAALRREKRHLRRGESLMAGVSYRLAPDAGARMLSRLVLDAADLQAAGVRFVFGGTGAVAQAARSLGFFEKVFDGSESAEQVLAFLRGAPAVGGIEADYPQSLVERINWRAPFPLLGHRFGLPTVEVTAAGIRRLAEAEALDVISLAADLDARENLFHPDRQDTHRLGTDGVPVRTRDDLSGLYDASRCGSYPLLQACSGTDDFIRYAEELESTIHNAWCCIPLFWHNRVDGGGPWSLQASIREHQAVLTWHGRRGTPTELDEPHHWSMRGAPDVVFVVAGFLSAYNAKKHGVKDYIAQLTFGLPPGISDAMDLAKMEALLQLIEPLSGPDFRIWRQTSLSVLSHPLDRHAADGHLAASTYLQMALRPHICHAATHAQAQNAAAPQDIIEASMLLRSAIQDAIGAPDLRCAPEVQERAQQLMSEAIYTLEVMRDLATPGTADPWTDPPTLARAVTTGVLDAPGLANNPFVLGRIRTRLINGGSDAVDRAGRPIAERQRLPPLL